MAPRAGFTLLEMLIAAGIATVVLLGGALLVTGSGRAHQATSDSVRASANLATATRFLHDDLRAARPGASAATGTDGCASIDTPTGLVRYCNTPAGAVRSIGDDTAPLTRAGGHVTITRVGNQYRVELLSGAGAALEVLTIASRLEAHRE